LQANRPSKDWLITQTETPRAITRYEGGTRKIPGVVEVALSYIAQVSFVPLTGIVAAGDSIEPIPQIERVEVPKSMMGPGEGFGTGERHLNA
jgi:repressor LexA